MRAGLVIATCEHVGLALQAAETAARKSDSTGLGFSVSWEDVFFYDDASPPDKARLWDKSPYASLFTVERSVSRQGCTTGWNAGLRWARSRGLPAVVIANDDVIFSVNWSRSLAQGVTAFSLVGPLSNTPGTANPAVQGIWNYVPAYRPSDDLLEIDRVASLLPADASPIPSPVNGFCMAGRVSAWWQYAWSPQEVFNPAYPMGGNEDDLQRRGRHRGMTTAVCPGSFVFHYRSLSRGPRFARDMWYRPSGESLCQLEPPSSPITDQPSGDERPFS
jgi:GT2 family glycosyltransferase